MVIGMISYPLVEKMVAKRVPVAGAAAIVLVFLVVVDRLRRMGGRGTG